MTTNDPVRMIYAQLNYYGGKPHYAAGDCRGHRATAGRGSGLCTRRRSASIGDPAVVEYMPARDLGTLGEAGKWLILLSDCVAEQDLPSVVAHEIAHVGLEHEALLGGDAWIDAEEAAATLVGEWGFSGLGVRPSTEGVARRSTVR